MATIRKRGKKWHVQIRRAGYPCLTKSFESRGDAAIWAREKERGIDRAELPLNIKQLKGLTIADLLVRYSQQITPRKRGAAYEASRIRTLLAHRMARTSLNNLSGSIIAQYRDERLTQIKSASVRRELGILRHVFEVARREWDLPLRENPFIHVRLPLDSPPRERRLLANDEAALFGSLTSRAAWYMRPFLILLIETGMRRGELLSIQWKDIDLPNRTVRILATKNGHPRTIPLTPTAIDVLQTMRRIESEARVFPVSQNAIRLAGERLRNKAGLESLRLHDLRHEAVSRFFEYGLSIPEVALISGHRDLAMLHRYTHLKPENIAKKLTALGEDELHPILQASAETGKNKGDE